jgi:TolB-like protein
MKIQSLAVSALLCTCMSSVAFAGSLSINNGTISAGDGQNQVAFNNGQLMAGNGQNQISINTGSSAAYTTVSPASLPTASYSEFSRNTNNAYDSTRNVNAAGRFNDMVRFLADQLTQNRDIKNLSDTPFAVASVVSLDDVSRTNKLGFLLQEHLLHELQARGFKVVDFKLLNDQIQVTRDGDFAFSRDPKKLRKSYDISQVVSGTYAFEAEGVVVNLRAIDTKTGVISSTAQGYFPRSDYEYITTGREGTYYNGEYYYRESQQVHVIDVPVGYPGSHNKVMITK